MPMETEGGHGEPSGAHIAAWAFLRQDPSMQGLIRLTQQGLGEGSMRGTKTESLFGVYRRFQR